MSNQDFYGSTGTEQPQSQTTYYAAPQQTNYHPGYPGYPGGIPGMAPTRPTNPLAIAGFVLAILGLGFFIPVLGWLAIPFVLVGLILSIIAYNKARSGAPMRTLALAGLLIAGITLAAGTAVNILAFRHSAVQFNTATPLAVPPSGTAAEALVGDWAFEGEPWYRFNADGTGENLDDGERFNWHEDGTFSNAIFYRYWSIENGILTVTWSTNHSFEYTKITQ